MLRKIVMSAGVTMAALGIAVSVPGSAMADPGSSPLAPSAGGAPPSTGTTPPSAGRMADPTVGEASPSPLTKRWEPPTGSTEARPGWGGVWMPLRWYEKTLEGRARCGIEAAVYENNYPAQCQSTPKNYVLMAFVPY